MGIVTKKGDSGKTALLTGQIVDKDSKRITAVGTADELLSLVAVSRSFAKSNELNAELLNLQNTISKITAELSCEGESKYVQAFSNKDVNELELKIAELESKVRLKKEFIVFGENNLSSFLNLARAVSRRLESFSVSLYREKQISEHLYIFLNRLSDYIFLLSVKVRNE